MYAAVHLPNRGGLARRFTGVMVKARSKKSKEDKPPAATVKGPETVQEDDGENLIESSPEDRRRKVPSTSTPAADVTTAQEMVTTESTAKQPAEDVQHVAY